MKWLKRRKKGPAEDNPFGPTIQALDKKRDKSLFDKYVDLWSPPGSPLWILKKVFGKDKERDK